MNIKYSFVLFFVMMAHNFVFSQIQTTPPVRQVIGTTGGSASFPQGTIDYTIGEPMGETFTTGSPFTVKYLTQGFQQPTRNSLAINLISVNSTCIGANNGSVSIQVLTATDSVSYTWQLPLTDTTATVSNLNPGTYYYSVSDGNFTINDSIVINEDQTNCVTDLIFYSAITPNGDGNNDNWIIDGILNYPDNVVSIYNRWGNLLWKENGYDNSKVVWDGRNRKGVAMPDATYFYICEIHNEVHKGWIQLTH